MGVVVSLLPITQKTCHIDDFLKDKVQAPSRSYYDLEGWTFNIASSWSERKAIYKLRAEIYDRELRWSQANDGYEVDIFDEFATHVVVKDPMGEIVATARTLGWRSPWMASECYSARFADEAANFRETVIKFV